MADTGSFHYPNTTDRTLKVASELVKIGVKPSEISEAVYNGYTWGRIELMREVLQTVKRDPSGRVASMRQTREMRRKSKAIDGDNSNFVNIPMTAHDIEAVVFMRERREGEFRVSLRSKGDVNVAKVAERFGGGGHKNAAGCLIKGDWDQCERDLVAALVEAVDKVHVDELELTFA
jgi:phosphoesterase RecJ-like protein